MRLASLLLFVLLVGLAMPLTAQDRDPRLEERTGDLRQRLVALADWCREKGLLRERQRLLEMILVLVPHDRDLREAAGYVPITSKRWERRKGFRSPLRTDAEVWPDFEQRFDSLVDLTLATVASLVREGEAPLPLADRRDLVEAMALILPRDDRLREALGERKKGSRWYLDDSLAARERRANLRRQAKLLLEGAGEPAKMPVPDPEGDLDLRWRKARLLPGVEVVGTVSDEEIEAATRIAWATINWFRLATRRDAATFPDYRIVLLASAGDRDLYLHFDRRIDDSARRFAADLSSFWVPGSSTVLIWAADQDLRKEWVARQTIAMLLKTGYGIGAERGAIYEGLGLYLSHKVTDLRSTWYVRQTRYDQKRDDRIAIDTLKLEKSWLKLAKRRARARAPDCRRLLGLEVNQMEVEDLVLAYAFAAYLVEGAPERLDPFLDRIGRGMNFENALSEVWGLDGAEMGEWIGRWLKESVDG
ncbi:MAG: hypothetical protein H6807_06785 [Planctomycetes bacterium]|nr:hypothetical protein [Planctomycetota bacterium]